MRRSFLAISLLLPSICFAQNIPDRKNILVEERAKFGATLNQEQAGLLLTRTAWRLRSEGFGLLRKDSGNNCPIPNSDIRISCDWLIHQPTGKGCDVLGDGPDSQNSGPSNPNWCDGTSVDLSKFIIVLDDPGGSGAPLTPTPGTDLTSRVIALEELVQKQILQISGLNETVVKLLDRIQIIENKPIPPEIICEEISINTNRALWHSHVTKIPSCHIK
jgi:hypothetical protein